MLLLRKAASACACLFVGASVLMAHAESKFGTKFTHPGESAVTERVTLGLDKSMVIDLPKPAADIVITNPEIADAVIQTSQRIIFRGVSYGQTNAFVFDRHGNQLLNLEIAVEMDMAGLHDLVARHVPEARVRIEGLNGNIVITGRVNSLSEADQVQRLVSAYVGGEETQIVNMLNVAAKDQVLLEVRIVEMQRSVIKQLGVNLSAAPVFDELGEWTGSFNSAVGFPLQGNSLGGLNAELSYVNNVAGTAESGAGGVLDALERIGVVRTLAEPQMLAMSGESGKFLAGGEFPVPSGETDDGQTLVEFKPYGVGLAFTPVVLSEGRISLKVSTEVSEITTQGSFQGTQRTAVTSTGEVVTIQGTTIPALIVRRAESVFELPSGGSIMMAGLISSDARQSLDKIPGIKNIPVLGALFQSRDYQLEETELVIIATPYLVDPTTKEKLATPADGYATPKDAKTILFGKINEQYGKDSEPIDADTYRAPVGFIEE